MKRMGHEKESLHPPAGSVVSRGSGLLKTGFFSLLLHLGLVSLLLFNLMSPYSRSGHTIYRVTLRPSLGDGNPPGSSGSGTRSPALPPALEKPKQPDQGAKREKAEENSKREREKVEVSRETKSKKVEPSTEERNVEGLKKSERREKTVDRSLQEALDDIRKKAALDRIQQKVALRGEKRAPEGPPPSSSQGAASLSLSAPAKGSSAGGPGSGTGKGTAPGRGTGTGPGTGTGSGGSPWGTSFAESELNRYYSLVWAKIKEGWTLPENLSKEKFDLEATIVLVIDKGGKLQRSWLEKRSGNNLYDQMAMRAIRKAEPFPPIPRELGNDSLEIEIRFRPE